MDPRRLRQLFGPELILAGGIDTMEIAKGRKAIAAELEAKIPALLQQGGYIPFLDHAIPPDISYADFMYYLERKLRLMGR
jgi:uroporphyrinogen decarboxylase